MTSVSSSRPRCFRSRISAADGLVGVAGESTGSFFGKAAVMVPAAVIELDEAHVALGEAAGEQAVGGERAGLAGIVAVELETCSGSFESVGEIGHAGLHAERHLVLRDAGVDLRDLRARRVRMRLSAARASSMVAALVARRTPGGLER